MMIPLVIVSRNVAAMPGPQIAAVMIAAAKATMVVSHCAGPGTFCRLMAASWSGSTPARDIANSVLVVVMLQAFAQAVTELTIARNTITQPTPQTSRASPSHGAPPPEVAKPDVILAGPKYTVEA